MKKAYAILLSAVFAVTALLGLFAFPDPGHTVEIWISGYGPVTVELEHTNARRTVKHVREAIKDGAYDNAYLYGVAYGITTYFGDMDGEKTRPSVIGEFEANGYGNGAHFGAGTVYLRRDSADYNSGRSAFCICLSDAYGKTLEGLYAPFGQVTDGMDIIAELSALPTDKDGVPTEKVYIESVEITDSAFLTARSFVFLGIALVSLVGACVLYAFAAREKQQKKTEKSTHK